MAKLHDRLKTLRELKEKKDKEEKSVFTKPRVPKPALKEIEIEGWEQCGFQVLKRDILTKSTINSNAVLPQTLKVVIPDLLKYGIPKIEDFLFFDLETTGLSGGAGTVAFLAAFGRFVKNDNSEFYKLKISQYLLLDFPGVYNFLNTVLKEFEDENSVIVSYNGKTFDAQILKSMCLMNGLNPPEFKHIDLLHPARRLWKNIIGDCSQASIETKILGLSREGDIPGALAPEIWFEFLKTGKTERLIGICDHNISDIEGLSCMLGAMIEIANDPLINRYNIDIPRLTFFWRDFCCRGKRYSFIEFSEILDIGIKLLRHTQQSNYSEDIKNEATRFLMIYERRWK